MLQKVKSLFNDLGWAGACLYSLSKIIEKLLPHSRLIYYHIAVQPIPSSPVLAPHRGKNFEFRILVEEDELLKSLPRPKNVIESRFQQGSICLAATLKKQLVGCIWLQIGRYREDEVRSIFTPASNEISWDYDVYVCESQRMGFLFTKLWDEAAKYLQSRNVRFTASRISGFNIQSLNSHRRLGAITVQNIVYLVFGPLQVTISSKRPWCHLSMSDNNPPVILVAKPSDG